MAVKYAKKMEALFKVDRIEYGLEGWVRVCKI